MDYSRITKDNHRFVSRVLFFIFGLLAKVEEELIRRSSDMFVTRLFVFRNVGFDFSKNKNISSLVDAGGTRGNHMEGFSDVDGV